MLLRIFALRALGTCRLALCSRKGPTGSQRTDVGSRTEATLRIAEMLNQLTEIKSQNRPRAELGMAEGTSSSDDDRGLTQHDKTLESTKCFRSLTSDLHPLEPKIRRPIFDSRPRWIVSERVAYGRLLSPWTKTRGRRSQIEANCEWRMRKDDRKSASRNLR